MEFETKNSVSDGLKKYCYHANDNDYIEVTEWTNGEGFEASITRNNNIENYSFTYGELDAIDFLIKSLRYHKYEKINESRVN